MLGLIVTLIVVGLIAGALARLLLPGKQDISIPMTIAIGIVGSFVGGFIGYAFHHGGSFFQPAGLFGSVIGALIVLFAYTRLGGRKTLSHS